MTEIAREEIAVVGADHLVGAEARQTDRLVPKVCPKVEHAPGDTTAEELQRPLSELHPCQRPQDLLDDRLLVNPLPAPLAVAIRSGPRGPGTQLEFLASPVHKDAAHAHRIVHSPPPRRTFCPGHPLAGRKQTPGEQRGRGRKR